MMKNRMVFVVAWKKKRRIHDYVKISSLSGLIKQGYIITLAKHENLTLDEALQLHQDDVAVYWDGNKITFEAR